MKALKNTLLFLSCLTLCSMAYAAPCCQDQDCDSSDCALEQCEQCDPCDTEPCDPVIEDGETTEEADV